MPLSLKGSKLDFRHSYLSLFLSYIAIVICFYLKEYAADYSFSQNSIFSLLGPSMVKNFTPFSQKGRPFTC